MNFLYFIGGFLALIIVVLFVLLLILKFKEEERPQDNTLFVNFMPQYAEGHTKGVIDEVFLGDRVGVSFYPRDIDYVKLFKNKEKAKIRPQLVFFEKRKLITFPKGVFSSHRNEIWGLPPQPEDLPEEIKKTEFGVILMKMIQEINLKDHEVKILREDVESVKEINKRGVDKEYLVRHLDEIDEWVNDRMKSLTKEEKRIFPTPTKL